MGPDAGAASVGMRERLLGAALAWLEGVDEDALCPSAELAAISVKADTIAHGLPFATLADLQESRPQAFRRLLSLASFVPAFVALEQKVAEQAELLRVQR